MEYEPRRGRSPKRTLLGRMGFEGRLLLLALMGGLPGSAVAIWLLWSGDFTPTVQWTFSMIVLCSWLGFAFAARGRVVFSLQILSNLLAALREGDYSFRARIAGGRND